MMLVAKALHDALPPDAVVMRLSAREAMSELFIVDVEVACTDATLDLASFAWSTMAVVLAMDEAPDVDPRWFHGIVEEARLVRSTRLATYYRFRLRPLVHGLDYRVRTRLFQEKCAVDVVKQVISEAGLADDAFVWATSGQDPVRELCMQYREAELAFVLRLLEDEGIYYWFEHDETGHRMHLTDDGSGIALIDGSAVLTFTERQDPDTEHITDVRWSTDLCSDAHITRDWNWENPNDVVESEQSTPTAAGFTRYEYPGGFRAADDGGRRALARLRESTLSEMELVGRTACRRLSPGRIFGVVGAQPSMIDGDYLIVSVRHEYAHIEGAGRGPVYAAHVRAIPSSHPFAPPRVTPKPRVAGKESAVITGPAGEEIHVDSMGRVKVHFYFDRENPVDDTASCWVRTQQVNLGGSMVLPRLGWEVSVGFQEGDPDRPVVMQKLYNRETLPPLSLPAEKTKTALESTSSPGGGNTNSIIMGDAGGAMTFAMHASKKLMVMAGNDMSRTVKVNRKAEIGIHDNLAVVGDETVEVSGTQTVSVTANTTLGTTASKTVTIKGAEDLGTEKNLGGKNDGSKTHHVCAVQNVLANKVDEAFNATLSRTVGAAYAINAAKAIVEAVGGAKTESVGAAKIIKCKSFAENIGAAKALTSGMVTEKTAADVTYGAGGAIAHTAAGPISVKCGGDYIFSGKTVRITAPGGMTIKGGGSKITMKGSKITMKASSMGASGGPSLQLKGTINYKP